MEKDFKKWNINNTLGLVDIYVLHFKLHNFSFKLDQRHYRVSLAL